MLLQHKKDLELDDMGVSASICQMLESSTGRWNMLYEYEKCFNGQRITHHQLNQLHNTQKYWYSKGLKFFTMMETNMAHNDHFTHIKHLDASMAYYLHQVTSDMNDVMSIGYVTLCRSLRIFYINTENLEKFQILARFLKHLLKHNSTIMNKKTLCKNFGILKSSTAELQTLHMCVSILSFKLMDQ